MDVPSPIDFHDAAQARDWVEQTVAGKPWRPLFFAAFAAALKARFASPCTVLEIGSGPGHLAREILSQCSPAAYLALDFSAPMHELARAHLAALVSRVTFIERGFTSPDWAQRAGAGGCNCDIAGRA